MLFQFVFHQGQREFCAKDRDSQLRKHPGQSADVVFMSVGQHNPADFIAVLQEISNVRDNDIDPEQFGFREHQAGVDNDNVVTIAHGHAVHSKFAEAAKGYKMEFMGGHGQQMMLTERVHGVGKVGGHAPLADRAFIRSQTSLCCLPSTDPAAQPQMPFRQNRKPAYPTYADGSTSAAMATATPTQASPAK